MESGDRSIDTEEMKTPRRKRLAERLADGGFFAQWQRDRMPEAEKSKDTEEDDDDEESSTGKLYGRARRLGAWLFGRRSLVTKEELPTEHAETGSFDLGAFFSKRAEETPREEQADIVETQDTSEPAAEIIETEVPETDGAEEAPAEGEGPAVEEDETVNEADPEDKEEEEVAPVTGTSVPQNAGPGPSSSSGGAPLSPGLAPRQVQEQEVVRERVIEHGKERLAALALLATGAEYIGRRRADARQERRFNKKLETTEKKATIENQILKARVERLAERNKEEARLVAVREEQFERQLRDQTQRREVQAPVRREAVRTRPEQAVTASADRFEQRSAIARETVPVYERPSLPVEQAPERHEAQAKQPLEKLYEQRHEIKDDNTVAGTAQQAALQTVQDDYQSTSQHLASFQANSGQRRRPGDKELQRQNPQLYKHAVTMGLWGALMIVIFGLIIYLVAR